MAYAEEEDHSSWEEEDEEEQEDEEVADCSSAVAEQAAGGTGHHVYARKAMSVGSLCMVPIVTGISSMGRLTQTAPQGHVLKVSFTQSGNIVHWHLMGSGSLPKASAVAEGSHLDSRGGRLAKASAVAEVNEQEITQHKWVVANNPCPV